MQELERGDRTDRVPFLPAGSLEIGCNYWASHAGTNMWRRWDPTVVEADFALLARRGFRLLRVFPLWPDFQPIISLRGGRGRIRGFAVQPVGSDIEEPLQSGADGLDPAMLRRLSDLADLAARNGTRLIVALITGWMSGRLHVPPALENRNPIADADAVQWQVRLVRGIVSRLADHPAVEAWDLGNECNAMGEATPAQSWMWTAAITHAVRAADRARPVISGMHGLATDPGAAWSIAAQGELTDLLTVHPYPLFTPHCGREPLDTMRPILHAAAEARLYGDLGSKPAFAEEIGSLGPMVSGEGETAGFARAAAFSLWAYDCRALLWWCAFDQNRLEHAPYEWEPVERELGLFRSGGEAKPVVGALEGVGETLTRLRVSIGPAGLPPRSVGAACVLPSEGDGWGAAFSAFILAVQAGFDLAFHAGGSPLPAVPLYILPSVRFSAPMRRSAWKEILGRVEHGAVLFASLDDGVLSEFSEVFGVRVTGRSERAGEEEVSLRAEGIEVRFRLQGGTEFRLEPGRAEVLGAGRDGRPIFTRARYGDGVTYLLAFPLEAEAARRPGGFDGADPFSLWRIYREISGPARAGRAVEGHPPFLGVTEHPEADGRRIIVAVNYRCEAAVADMTLRPEWSLSDVLLGEKPAAADGGFAVRVPAHDACVFRVARE
jgi:hypothetical protein